MVICLERDADLHMPQLMPLPLTVSCFSKIQIGFTFLVPAYPGSPGKGPLNGCVCVCVMSENIPSYLVIYFSAVLFRIGTGKLLGPKGVCCDPNGRIIVVDNRGSAVYVFQSNGRIIHKFGSRGSSDPRHLAGPHFCAVTPSGREVVITDFHNHCVKVLRLVVALYNSVRYAYTAY